MKILFATTNESKIKRFKENLEKYEIDILSIKDLDFTLNIEENGKNAIENAHIKAKAYYDKTNIITMAMDDNLYIEGIPDELQPGTHVRRVKGKELSDDEMIIHYTKLCKKYGEKLNCKWVYGLVIYIEDNSYEYSWSKGGLYLVSKPTANRNIGYPLNSITVSEKYGKYLSDLTKEEKSLDKNSNDEGVINFILNTLNIN